MWGNILFQGLLFITIGILHLTNVLIAKKIAPFFRERSGKKKTCLLSK